VKPLQKILHVDDEPDIREIVRLSLAMVGGFDLLQTGSGMEAIELAGDYAPELIILDVMMPGLDGTATFEGLRKVEGLAETPIIFMTARATDSDYQRLRDLGAIDVLVKPFDPMALPDQVRAIWDRHSA